MRLIDNNGHASDNLLRGDKNNLIFVSKSIVLLPSEERLRKPPNLTTFDIF